MQEKLTKKKKSKASRNKAGAKKNANSLLPIGESNGGNYPIESNISQELPPIAPTGQLLEDSGVHLNLRYYDKKHQCFSEWSKKDLKKFSSLAKELRERTRTQVDNVCTPNKGESATPPKELDPSFKMVHWELGKKARVHGVLHKNIFFLIFLDRNHKIHDGKNHP